MRKLKIREADITTTILTMSALAIAYEFFAYFIGSKWAIRALRKIGD